MGVPPRLTSRWVGVLALGVIGLVPGTASAQPAGHLGWRIVATVGPRGLTALNSLSAANPSDAWAAGITCINVCGPGFALIEHWNGTAWRKVPDPAGLPAGTSGGPVAATSATNVWIGIQNTTDLTVREPLLHLLGHVWVRYTLPRDAGIGSIANFGRHDAWFFGSFDTGSKAGRQFNLRYNGHSLRRFTLPTVADEVSAAGPDDIWASGPMPVRPGSTTMVDVAMHWNGRSWSTIRFPSIRPPAGWREFAHVDVALGPRNVLGDYTFSNSLGCCKAGGLLHWDGRTWHRIRLPASIADFAGNMVPDGRGGIWLEGGAGERAWMFDYSGGHWSRFSIPTLKGQQLSSLNLAWIPRTRSVWATSIVLMNSGSASEAVILKYGP